MTFEYCFGELLPSNCYSQQERVEVSGGRTDRRILLKKRQCRLCAFLVFCVLTCIHSKFTEECQCTLCPAQSSFCTVKKAPIVCCFGQKVFISSPSVPV